MGDKEHSVNFQETKPIKSDMASRGPTRMTGKYRGRLQVLMSGTLQQLTLWEQVVIEACGDHITCTEVENGPWELLCVLDMAYLSNGSICLLCPSLSLLFPSLPLSFSFLSSLSPSFLNPGSDVISEVHLLDP